VAQRNPEVSDAELEVLKVLWEHGPGTVRDVEASLRQSKKRWAYTTVLTLLHRLQAKGYVKSDKRELAHVFSAVVTRERLVRQRLRDVADSLCEGAATPLVLALVEGQRFSSEELEQFRKLLDELEAKKRK
jgi:predicted transcriptional regulator